MRLWELRKWTGLGFGHAGLGVGFADADVLGDVGMVAADDGRFSV